MKNRALHRIRDQIERWEQEGHKRFKDDLLEPSNEKEWDRLCYHYFEREKYTSISVNAANLCPSLKQVGEMTAFVQEILDADISFSVRRELAQASLGNEYGLGAIKEWLGLDTSPNCKPEHLVALLRNTTEGNNFINNGLVASGFFNPQKNNVIVWDVNHPTNLDAWYYRQATQAWSKNSIVSLKLKMFSQSVTDAERASGWIPSDPQREDDIIKPLKNLLHNPDQDDQTRVVSLSWQSNECGMLLPMKRIVSEVRSVNKDIHIHADCAQTFGVLDLQLDKTGVDSITGSFHKWPCGPKMVGIIYMNEETGAAKRFVPGIWGYDEYIQTPLNYGYDPEEGIIDSNTKRFSYLGQQNDATLVSTWVTALFHSGKLHPNVSPLKIQNRIRYLGDQLKEALYENLPRVFPDFKEKPFEVILTPTTMDDLRTSIFLFKLPKDKEGKELSAGAVVNHLYIHHRYAIANLKVNGHNVIRISPTIFNSSAEVRDVVVKTVDIMEQMIGGKLSNHTDLNTYA